VRHHYDVSNRFYEMLLGPSLVYSCAYFASPDDSLERAQERKLELICRKLRLQPGERLLDIGCGWGSLGMHAAGQHCAPPPGAHRRSNPRGTRNSTATGKTRGSGLALPRAGASSLDWVRGAVLPSDCCGCQATVGSSASVFGYQELSTYSQSPRPAASTHRSRFSVLPCA